MKFNRVALALVALLASQATWAQNEVTSESKRPAQVTPSTATTESAGRQPSGVTATPAPGGATVPQAGNMTGATTQAGTVGATTGTVGTGDATTANSGDRQAPRGGRVQQAWDRTHRASKIIGTDVRNRSGQKLGAIKDVVLDSQGNVAYAVVSTGGFLGLRDRMHAIPWQALQTNTGRDHFLLDMDKQQLKQAPGFDSKNWPDMADERWSADVRRHYGNPGAPR